MEQLTIFRNRLLKIGLDCQFIGNYPWIYLDTINGKKVKGTYLGDHGFTAFFTPIKAGQIMQLTNIGIVFKKIRETINTSSSNI